MWPHKSVTIKVNHVIGVISNPNFCFPSNIGCKFLKSISRQKSRNVNNVSRAILGQLL